MKRLRVGVAAAGIALLAGGLVYRTHWDASLADQAAETCRKLQALQRSRDDGRPVSLGGATVVVLGDSYAQGVELADPRQSWPAALGRAEHWTTYVNAFGGSGFTNPGACGRDAFQQRAAAVLTKRPQTVIVQGGLNDVGAPLPQVQAALEALLRALAAVPLVVVVGPTHVPAFDARAVDTALATTAAGKAHVQYVSSYDWVLPYGADGIHLTAAGHQKYATLLERQITSS